MQQVTQQLDLLMSWISWGSLALCVAGIFLVWIMWRNDIEIGESLSRIVVIIACVAVISNAVRIAQWII
jgi:hypothetical protein